MLAAPCWQLAVDDKHLHVLSRPQVAFHIVALSGPAPLQHKKEAVLKAHHHYHYDVIAVGSHSEGPAARTRQCWQCPRAPPVL